MFAFIFSCLSAFSTVCIAQLFSRAFDVIFRDPDSIRTIYIFSTQIIAVFSLRGVGQYGERFFLCRIINHVICDVQNHLFAHVIHQNMAFFNHYTTGELTNRIIGELNQIRSSFVLATLTVTKDLLTILLLLGFMLYIDYHLTLYASLFLPIILFPLLRLTQRINGVMKSAQENNARLSSRLNDVLSQVKTVKSYGREPFEVDSFEKLNTMIQKDWTRNAWVGGQSYCLTEILSGLMMSSIVLYGAIQIFYGQGTTGDIMGFLSALLLAYEPLRRIIYSAGPLTEVKTVFDRVNELLAIRPIPHTGRIVDHTLQGKIEFRDVSFGYDLLVLRNFNLVVEPGERISIMGPSGLGKTSILDLLMRFYEPSHGQILLDEVPIQELNVDFLRSQIGYMNQDLGVFDRSALENIEYGNRADLEAVEDLAEKLGMLGKLREETLGEHGERLSGGERQRIALMRVLLGDRPILLLDEPLSSLDPRMRKKANQVIEEYTRGKTVLIISHLPVPFVDRVVSLKTGA